MKIFRNTAAVLVLTLFTGLAVFTAVQLGDRPFGTSDAAAQSTDPYSQGSGTPDSATTQTCPATGCAASSCHATQ